MRIIASENEKRLRSFVVYPRCFINSEGSCRHAQHLSRVNSLFRGDPEKSFLVKDFRFSRERRETVVDHATVKPVPYSSFLVDVSIGRSIVAWHSLENSISFTIRRFWMTLMENVRLRRELNYSKASRSELLCEYVCICVCIENTS